MFRKIFILICLLFLASPCFATDYFLDLSHDQANGGDGTTMQTDGGADDAFKTFAEAYASVGADDVCWIRRITNVTQGADVAPTQNGTAETPAIWIGWPRDADSWDCDFVNGDATVDNIDEDDATWSTHAGRWLTGPDGFDYLITSITDTDTVEIDRPYAGTTAANQVVAIKADELPQGVSEPADTDGWSADGDALALIDFDDGDFQARIADDNYNQFWNIEFKDSTDASGVVYTSSVGVFLNGCLFSQSTQNDMVFNNARDAALNRCIFKGFGGANSNVEVNTTGTFRLTNSAIYNMGDFGIASQGATYLYLENVNIGVEVANSDDDLLVIKAGRSYFARDLKLGGTNGDVLNYDASTGVYNTFISTNHNKVLGAWKQWFWYAGTAEKVAVTGVTPNKKLSDNVIEITPDTNAARPLKEIDQKVKVFESRKTYAAGTYNVKLWIYNDTGNTLNDTTFSDDILMRCRAEAGNYGDATTEYVSMPWTNSDEIDILDAADEDDWDHLQCDSVVVDTNDSKIYCEVLISTSDAEADNIYIDPQTSNP